MLVDKKILTDADLESQAALELPDREMMLVTIVIGNLLSGNTVTIDVRNVDVALQVCANVLANLPNLTCEVQQ